jgi:hypothetical protein
MPGIIRLSPMHWVRCYLFGASETQGKVNL